MKIEGMGMQVSRGISQAIAIGGSSGSTRVIKQILASLPVSCRAPLLLVRHLHARDNGAFARHLGKTSRLPVVEPHDKQRIEAGHVYVAPANYHLLVETDQTVSLSVCQHVNWSRPSIDVLFDSAARTWGAGLVAVILSGASSDGAKGLMMVKKMSGQTIAQQPDDAMVAVMPDSAMQSVPIDHVVKGNEIGPLLSRLLANDMARQRAQ